MTQPIAIVGMACRFPGANSIAEFWENILAQRRAFRRIPSERLRLEDYFSEDRAAEDRIYSKRAALIEGWEFPREKFCVSGEAYRSSDLTHWLALHVASEALVDAGFQDGHGLPKESTGVFLGNTLTGEFSRANVLRLRWPYVRRVTEESLKEKSWNDDERRNFLDALETRYKAPFPATGDETLAGSLSNTIAGRICNYYDLNGGGYTVDGACASSLLSITNACAALSSGDLDVVIAGGVDLSLDPFELVGFAKAGALASDTMRVYDARSDGFIPGEGCGLVVLMRHSEAVASGARVYAVIPGWGISSDGSGGLTRPDAEGQRLAIDRAWKRAGLSVAAAAYVEGHGTGTSVGDSIELTALTNARKGTAANSPVAIGSVKALIGHCKAAAGAAGLIKAALVVYNRFLPPTAGCERPHQLASGNEASIRVLSEGERWSDDCPLHVAVSGMGFGGINAHLVLKEGECRQVQVSKTIDRAIRSSQDAELFVFSAPTREELLETVDSLVNRAAGFSLSDLTDAAAAFASQEHAGTVRAAIIASTPEQLSSSLTNLRDVIVGESTCASGVYFAESAFTPRIGFLFPGQGSPTNIDGGLWRRRFAIVSELYAQNDVPRSSTDVATEMVQPAIVRNIIAALRILKNIEITADAAVGHSLGELAALHWAGVIGEDDLRNLVAQRGEAMGSSKIPRGTMAAISADHRMVATLINGEQVKIAGINSPRQTVISGAADDVNKVLQRARSQKISGTTIPVSHAFHSPLMESAAEAFADDLRDRHFAKAQRKVFSTVTGALLNGENVKDLLVEQITSPVRFSEAVTAAGPIDLWIECGPGSVLKHLVEEIGSSNVCSLDAGGRSLCGLLETAGSAFVLGASLNLKALFEDRLVRPFCLDKKPRFFVNPCEMAPCGEATPVRVTKIADIESSANAGNLPVLERLRQVVADRAELPIAAVANQSRMLSDLHLNSIVVGRIISDVCRSLELTAPVALTEFADGSLEAIAEALDELKKSGLSDSQEDLHPPGVGTWVRAFRQTLIERTLPVRKPVFDGDWHLIVGDDDPRRNDIAQALHRAGGGGVALCLPEQFDDGCISLLLRAAMVVREGKFARRFVLVQGEKRAASSFVRTMHLEVPELVSRVLCFSDWTEKTWDSIAAEVAAADSGFAEVHYDRAGKRFEPVIQTIALDPYTATPSLTPEDLILITGGGKGIAAECGLELAKRTGVRLALMGRSRPENDPELAKNLNRIRAVASATYTSADVSDHSVVKNAIREIEAVHGPITAVLHGAGTNVPQLLNTLDEAAFQRTLTPKIQGLRNILGAIDPERLRVLIVFGSIIARVGLRGEADYAVANERLAQLVEDWGSQHPHCKAVTLEWSVWSGTGMGQRLGRVESLLSQGITPISPDQGVDAFLKILSSPLPVSSVIVAGRFGQPPDVTCSVELPFRRYLQTVRVHYPGVELVADSTITAESDPHILDHKYRGQPLFAAVMGLEAISQVAMSLAKWQTPPVFENVRFERPVTCPTTIRVAALLQEDGSVDAVLRSSETGFQVDHFRATCRSREEQRALKEPPCSRQELSPDILPNRDLYGGILFQEGRYRRVRGYRLLQARECIVEIESGETDWFDRYAAAHLELGDPGARDAVIHSTQACIPHRVLLPTGVDRLTIYSTASCPNIISHARERSCDGDTFVYDIEVTGDDGEVRELWEGLRLRAVENSEHIAALAESLVPVYLERRLMEATPKTPVKILFSTDESTEKTLYRPDGKPDGKVSASWSGLHRLSLAAESACGCDAESVLPRSQGDWLSLLGVHRYQLAAEVALHAGETTDVAATRIWCALECLKKAGLPYDAPLSLRMTRPQGSVELVSGQMTILSVATGIRDVPDPVMFSFAIHPKAYASNI